MNSTYAQSHAADLAALRPAFAGARALITGGAGFIAGHLASALRQCGAEVTLVDAQRGPGCVQLHVGTPALGRLLRACGPFDYMFHLAARAYAADSVQLPMRDFTANLAATIDLLEQLRAGASGTRLVFASSAAVYGNPARLPIEEGDITVPISPYGVSKLAAERYVQVYARLYGIPAASLRLFSVYGPGQAKQVVYDFFAKLQRTPDELVVIGDGSQMRDMVYVGDVARAFLTVAARGARDGGVYNVASGVATSTADLARMVVDAQGARAAIRFTGQARAGDPERWLGSFRPLSALGWQPRMHIRDGIGATAGWFNQAHALAEREVTA
jgi:UDP-glucose 4-epimerase